MERIKVIIENKQKKVKIPTGLRMIVRRCCNAVLQLESFQGSATVNVIFVDNAQIQELNKKHRDKDIPTDVLSFPMGENGKYDVNLDTGEKILGDIVISIERALDQSVQFNHGIQREVGFLTVHSMLHLLGYDHESGGLEKVRMREKEERVMSWMGLPNTPSYVMEESLRKAR